MSFLADYITYNEGNECPETYHIWSALVLLSSVVGPKVVLKQGYFDIFPNLYVLLVGEQGGRKTVAKDIAFELLRELFPKIPTAASCESHQSICQDMGADDSLLTFEDTTGNVLGNGKPKTQIEFRQLAMFITEFRNFLSINPGGMVNFLTDIYDRTKTYYNYKTRNKGKDHIIHPYVTILACETPDNLISDLKLNIVTGGFFRRAILIFETEYEKRIPRPEISPKALAAMVKVRDFLIAVKKVNGVFSWSKAATVWFDNWYTTLKMPHDPFLRGFYRSKHVQMLKVAMLLSLCESHSLVIELKHLQIALELLNKIEANLSLISAGVGRNMLVQPTAKLMRLLDQNNGYMLEKRLRVIMFADMSMEEYDSVRRHLERTDQIIIFRETKKKPDGTILSERDIVASVSRLEEVKARLAAEKTAVPKSLGEASVPPSPTPVAETLPGVSALTDPLSSLPVAPLDLSVPLPATPPIVASGQTASNDPSPKVDSVHPDTTP